MFAKIFVNAVTCLRFPLAVMTAFAIWHAQYAIAALCFTLGLVTDWIDGPLARILKAETTFGAEWLEPAADISLMLGGVVGFMLARLIPWWPIIPLVIIDRSINWVIKPRMHRPDRILLFQAILLEGTAILIALRLLYLVRPSLAFGAIAIAPFIAYAKRERIKQFAAHCFRAETHSH